MKRVSSISGFLCKPIKLILGDDQDLYKITPGMQATVDIHTGLEAEA
jgi:hypothetical protein